MNPGSRLHGCSTPHQRERIIALLQQAGLSVDRFGYQHGRTFDAAGIPDPPWGGDVQAHVARLPRPHASALIETLKAQVHV